MTRRAIDVSKWQGRIDWAAVKAAGVDGAWIKVGGADGGPYADPRAGENMAGAAAAGLPYGTYYFASPKPGDAVAQARHAVSCGHGNGPLWPVLDLEKHNQLTGDQLDDFALEWCAEIERLTSRHSIIYTGSAIGVGGPSGFFGCRPALREYPLWIANYGRNHPGTTPPNFQPTLPPAWARRGWSMWQHNSVTAVPGIAGNVDQTVVTDEFWATMTTGVASMATTPMEDLMGKALLLDGENAQWRLVDDGNGVLRRQLITSPAALSVLVKAGAVDDGGPVVLTNPDEITMFRLIPISNDQTSDTGALRIAANTIAEIRTATEQVLAADATAHGVSGVPLPVDPAALAADIVEELGKRLQSQP